MISHCTLFYHNLFVKIIGAYSIGKFLKNENQSLEVLWLSSNDIGDDGASLIVEGLQYNNGIKELMMDECKISAKGILHVHGWHTYL